MIVHATGPTCTVQDLGRPGWAQLGITRSGAADRSSHRLANRLVGNVETEATLEVTFGGLQVEFTSAAVIALTGAPCPIHVDFGPPVGHQVATTLPAGAVMRLGTPTEGLRTYLAVRGGLQVESQLGSRSTDTLGSIGPPVVSPGDVIEIGADPGGMLVAEPAPWRWVQDPTLTVHPGPRVDRLTEGSLVGLWCTVSNEVSRVGLRLDPDRPIAVSGDDLASEGLVAGAVQVPPDGRPIVFLVDHPVTGGYPVVGVVRSSDLDVVAQLRPGDRVRFLAHR